jgi:G:T/U-mismatch repair DNA glycosylase
MDKVSDTPRTNFVAHESVDAEWNRSMNRFGRMLAHACILERELAAQKEQFRVLEDEMLVMMDERNAAVLDAKENMEIANEFKHTMEEYRHREAEAYKALRVATEMLASQYYCDSSPAEVLEHLITKAREMK